MPKLIQMSKFDLSRGNDWDVIAAVKIIAETPIHIPSPETKKTCPKVATNNVHIAR